MLPPPLLLVLAAGLTWLTGPYAGWTVPALPGQAIAAAIIAGAGVLLIAWAGLRFLRAPTTVNPIHPERASVLVENGPYRFSRNPMYLADVLLLFGWTIHLGAPTGLAWTALFVWLLHRFQIPHEEAALAQRFNNAYECYRRRVRRWL